MAWANEGSPDMCVLAGKVRLPEIRILLQLTRGSLARRNGGRNLFGNKSRFCRISLLTRPNTSPAVLQCWRRAVNRCRACLCRARARGSGISCTRSAPIGEATSAPEKDDSLYRLIVTGTRGAS
jgi:hypothetical protein